MKYTMDNIILFYTNLPVFIIDNCGKYKNLGKMEEFKDLPVKFIKLNNKNPIPLTKIQWLIGLDLFCEYEALIFSADDIVFTNPGFVEKALRMLNNGDQIVSLSTDKDPVAYLYTF